MTAKIKIASYVGLVDSLLANLPDREREVLQRRNALSDIAEAHTLEQIGNDFNITRERVRQIEREGLKKLSALDYEKAKLPISDLQIEISDYLKAHGGIMAENHIKEKLLSEQKLDEERALNFILTNILGAKFNRLDNSNDYHIIWKLDNIDLDKTLEIVVALKDLISKHGNPLHLEDLESKFKDHAHYQTIDQMSGDNLAILEALLRLRKDLDKNILEQWGMINWNTITPKRMTDKAYLIMLREGKPLHFAQVADLINQADFDRKQAHPATVHNELILDDKYVLVGRGIYALKEWGYKEGTVADIISQILKAKGPVTRNELADEVLKQRMVQKTTITLALMDKERFGRLADGRYDLVK
ncbi:MAG: sigma factor-like helix-turn-helix DNA-binding protein [Patescibacteria group bacterium]